MPIDLAQIKSGEEFELLCEDLLQAMGFTIVQKPARGPDFGIDIIVNETIRDRTGVSEERKTLVQCKHYAHAGKAVSFGDIGSYREAMDQYGCRHYLLITSTVPTHDLQTRFQSTNERGDYTAAIWSKGDLARLLDEYPGVRERHFPSSSTSTPADMPAEDIGETESARDAEIGSPQTEQGIPADDDDGSDIVEGESKSGADDISDLPATSQASVEQVVRVTIDESAIAASAASDQPICSKDEDRLGFVIYAEAIAAFITSEDTTTPLVIGIDAPWGHGKTSLMHMIRNELNPKRPWYLRSWLWLKLKGWRIRWLTTSPIWYGGRFALWAAKWLRRDNRPAFVALAQWMRNPDSEGEKPNRADEAAAAKAPATERLLQWCLRVRQPIEARHPTVWFNAWKFDGEEAIWSALAVTILEQIKTNTSWIGRLFFWLRLWVKRFNHLRAWEVVAKKILWPVLLGGAGWLWAQYSGQIDLLPPLGRGLVQWVLWGGSILTAGIQMASIVQDPFSLSFARYVKAPNYRERIGFIGDFEEDFKHIVAIATGRVWGWKRRKLIIFIDDLDRCEPPKPTDVIEAINVFLDSPGCVFVIGMDSRAVVASIETKYETLFKKTQLELPDQPTLGHCFLQKIVQVPFAIPPVPSYCMIALLEQVIGPSPVQETAGEPGRKSTFQVAPPTEREPEGSPAGKERREDVGSYRQNTDVWEAISRGVKYLEANPRQVKCFVNLFRLQLYVAHARGLFRELVGEGESRSGYTLDSLAAWIALSMRWPRIAFCLRQEYQKAKLCQRLLWIAQLTNEKGDWIGGSDIVVRMDEGRLDTDLVRLLPQQPEILSDTPRRVLATELAAQHMGKREGGSEDSTISWGLDWRTFPWEKWLVNRDFLQVVKALEEWWIQPVDEQRDWLTMAMLCNEPGLTGQVRPPEPPEMSGKSKASTVEEAT